MNNLDFFNILDPEISVKEIHSILQETSEEYWKSQSVNTCNVFFYILEGEYTIYIDGRKMKIKENDLIYIPEEQAYKSAGKKLTFVGIYFSKHKTNEKSFFDEFHHLPGMKNMKNQFLEIARLFSRNPSGKSIKLMKQLYSIFDNMIRAELPGNESFKYYSTIKNAVEYIENNYMSDDINSVYLANLCNITSTHFARVFKKLYDTTPKDYIIKLRMKRAEEYLLYSAYSVLEIAELLGYNDPAYFSAAFKKNYGVSPSEFRKNN